MSKPAQALRAERNLIRLCHTDLAGGDAHSVLLRALRQVVPVDATFFATADPDTLLITGGWIENPLETVTELFLHNEFGGDDVNKFTSLATSDRPVATLDAATRGDRAASERYRDILRPLGFGDELRVALSAGGRCWGYLCLHREEHRLGFSRTEVGTLARLAPHLAHAVRSSVAAQGPASERSPRPGVVCLSDDLNVVAMTQEAQELLSLIAGNRTPALHLPMPVYAVVAALHAIERGNAPPAALPSAKVRTVNAGWVELHASRLTPPDNGTGTVSVVVESVEQRAVIPLILSAYGLSPREAEVTRLVLRGQATSAIADELHIATYTVQDHLKAVFDKLGVRSRRDLVSSLLGT